MCKIDKYEVDVGVRNETSTSLNCPDIVQIMRFDQFVLNIVVRRIKQRIIHDTRIVTYIRLIRMDQLRWF